jgi:hypothetical protein
MAGNRQGLDRALETIEAKVIELFAIIAEDLPQATAALLRGDGDVLSGLTARQQEINGWYPQVEAMVSQQILRPVTSTAPTAWWCISPPGPAPISARICRRPAGS